MYDKCKIDQPISKSPKDQIEKQNSILNNLNDMESFNILNENDHDKNQRKSKTPSRIYNDKFSKTIYNKSNNSYQKNQYENIDI